MQSASSRRRRDGVRDSDVLAEAPVNVPRDQRGVDKDKHDEGNTTQGVNERHLVPVTAVTTIMPPSSCIITLPSSNPRLELSNYLNGLNLREIFGDENFPVQNRRSYRLKSKQERQSLGKITEGNETRRSCRLATKEIIEKSKAQSVPAHTSENYPPKRTYSRTSKTGKANTRMKQEINTQANVLVVPAEKRKYEYPPLFEPDKKTLILSQGDNKKKPTTIHARYYRKKTEYGTLIVQERDTDHKYPPAVVSRTMTRREGEKVLIKKTLLQDPGYNGGWKPHKKFDLNRNVTSGKESGAFPHGYNVNPVDGTFSIGSADAALMPPEQRAGIVHVRHVNKKYDAPSTVTSNTCEFLDRPQRIPVAVIAHDHTYCQEQCGQFQSSAKGSTVSARAPPFEVAAKLGENPVLLPEVVVPSAKEVALLDVHSALMNETALYLEEPASLIEIPFNEVPTLHSEVPSRPYKIPKIKGMDKPIFKVPAIKTKVPSQKAKVPSQKAKVPSQKAKVPPQKSKGQKRGPKPKISRKATIKKSRKKDGLPLVVPFSTDDAQPVPPLRLNPKCSAVSQLFLDTFSNGEDIELGNHEARILPEDGAVISCSYVYYCLVVVQQRSVTFFQQTGLGMFLESQSMWIQRGRLDRLTFDDPASQRRFNDECVLTSGRTVTYVELFCKEHKQPSRAVPACDVFAVVYHRNFETNTLKCKVLQLDKFTGYARGVQFIVLQKQNTVVVYKEIHAGTTSTSVVIPKVTGYTFASDFEYISEGCEYESSPRLIRSLHVVEDCLDALVGYKAGNITIWNGLRVLTSMEFTSGQDYKCASFRCDRSFIFVLQYNSEMGGSKIRLVTINSRDYSFKTLQVYNPPHNYRGVTQVCVYDSEVYGFYKNGRASWNVATANQVSATDADSTEQVWASGRWVITIKAGRILITRLWKGQVRFG